MITKQQAEDIVQATSYRDWSFEPVNPDQLALWQLLGMIRMELVGKVAVRITYTAPDSTPGTSGTVENKIHVAIPLTNTEAEFARALYEMVATIEEHERREFFRVDSSVITDRGKDSKWTPRGWDHEGNSAALFHPHGVNRNRMFHDLDTFASRLTVDTLAGEPMTADAV